MSWADLASWALLFFVVAGGVVAGGLLLDAIHIALAKRAARRAFDAVPDVDDETADDVAKLVDYAADSYTLLEEIAAAVSRTADQVEAAPEPAGARPFRSTS